MHERESELGSNLRPQGALPKLTLQPSVLLPRTAQGQIMMVKTLSRTPKSRLCLSPLPPHGKAYLENGKDLSGAVDPPLLPDCHSGPSSATARPTQ